MSYLTEEEARGKWCPFALAEGGTEYDAGINRGRNNFPDHRCRCIASECMAWRWGYALEENEIGDYDRRCVGGYCGLAGKPEG